MRGVLGVSRCVFAHINPIPKPNQKLLNSETYRNPIQNKKLLNSETYRNPLQNPGNQTATGLPGFWMGFRWVSVGFGRFRWVSVGFGGFRWVSVGFGGFRYWAVPVSRAYLGQSFQNCALTLHSITFPWLQTANEIIGYSVSPHFANRIGVEVYFINLGKKKFFIIYLFLAK